MVNEPFFGSSVFWGVKNPYDQRSQKFNLFLDSPKKCTLRFLSTGLTPVDRYQLDLKVISKGSIGIIIPT